MTNTRVVANYTERYTKENGSPYYQGHLLIGRDTPIIGGAYFGCYGGEAIVVDPNSKPAVYSAWEQAVEDEATVKGKLDKNYVLHAIFNTVKDKMRYSKPNVENLLGRIAHEQGEESFVDGTKVDLSVFMNSGIGVCRHQALACGFLLERFVEREALTGQPRVLRNQMHSPDPSRTGGHAWAQYTTSGGQEVVLDVAQDYIGSPNHYDSTFWHYQVD